MLYPGLICHCPFGQRREAFFLMEIGVVMLGGE
jgi:hypothetical protein